MPNQINNLVINRHIIMLLVVMAFINFMKLFDDLSPKQKLSFDIRITFSVFKLEKLALL